MSKKFASFIIIVITIIISCTLLGCVNSGPIPNGYYIPYFSTSDTENDQYIFDEQGEDYCSKTCWEIKGHTAKLWVSASVIYKADIKEKDGKIYFEIDVDKDFVYEVQYDESNGCLTLIYIGQ